MSEKRIGVAAMGGDAAAVVERIAEMERMGVPAAWLTTGGAGLDGLTIFSAAAVRTENILLGTCITPTWPRHPVAAVQQVQVIANLAPGRFRFGVGPSHGAGMQSVFGADFRAPLTNVREYVRVVKGLLETGEVDFDGSQYRAHARIPGPVSDVPVMAAALRRRSFEFCGAETDGAITWVCPGQYLRDVAVPAIAAGAQGAGREAPPLITHAPVCVHDNPAEARAAFRQQMGFYPQAPFYARMFAEAGFPEAEEDHQWSDAMVEAVLLYGDEATVASGLRRLFDWGAGEVLVSVITAGADATASWRRTVETLVQVQRTL